MWVAVVVVTVMSSARLTRLMTYDHFPPVEKVRYAYSEWTERHKWANGYGLLAFCPYCASFWLTGLVVLWGWLTDWQTAWWVVNGIFAASYAAAIVMVHDGDKDED
jgi:O-antigen ligase